MAGRLAQFVARVARPHLPAWPRLAPQPMPVAPVSTPAAAPSPFAKHLAKLRALSPELHPPDTPLGRLQHLRNWVRTRNGMLTANVLLGGAASAAFVNPAPSADASTAGEGAVRATLNSPFEEYGFTFTNWDALSPSSKTLAPILAVNTVIWGVWQMANFCRTERCVRFMEDHFTCSIWNWKNYRVHTLVTSMFSHLSFMHLLFNNVAIWSIGSTVHRDVGRDNFLITYFGGGVLGSLTSLIYKAVTRTANPSVGASAAGYALFAMFSMNHPESRLQIIFLPFFSFAAKYMFYGAVAFDATMLLLRRSFLDHAAHLGGAAMGLAAYYTLPPAPKAPGRRVYRPAVRGPHGY